MLVVLAFGSVAWWWKGSEQPISHPPGVLVPHEPIQGEQIENPASIPLGEWTLTPLASYRIDARVLSKKRYRYDATAEISPYDLLLGWGPMSDSAVLQSLQLSQDSRYGRWRWEREPPLPHSEINRNAANNHLIPANKAVLDRIAATRPGSLVRIEGELVEARNRRGGKPWRSSLSRTDEGFGACEIIYVRSIREIPPAHPAIALAGNR